MFAQTSEGAVDVEVVSHDPNLNYNDNQDAQRSDDRNHSISLKVNFGSSWDALALSRCCRVSPLQAARSRGISGRSWATLWTLLDHALDALGTLLLFRILSYVVLSAELSNSTCSPKSKVVPKEPVCNNFPHFLQEGNISLWS